MNRVPTGIAGLDRILLGGFVPGSAVLVDGTPGSGKTNLGLQFVHCGATMYGEPGLVITFEEFSHQVIRDALALGWDLQALIGQRVLRIVPTSPAVFQQEMAGADGLISEMIREMGAKRILIDSVSHFARLCASETERREVFNALVNMLRRSGLTSLLTREVHFRPGLGRDEEVSFEQYAADAALRLSYEPVDETRRARYVEVVKARGQGFIPGKHLFDIAEGGLTVFPNFDPGELTDRTECGAIERLSTGVPGLDDMLEGGLVRGFTTLVAGPAGGGKTAIGMQFLAEGARRGEAGLFVSLRSSSEKLRRQIAALEVELNQPGAAPVRIACEHPAMVNPYRVLESVIADAGERNVRRVVLDSTGEIEQAFNDAARFQQWVFDFVNRLYVKGVTALLLGGPVGSFEPTELASTAIAGIVDGIIGLCNVHARGEIRQGLYVLKSRGAGHSTDVRPYTISAGGLRVVTRRVSVYDE